MLTLNKKKTFNKTILNICLILCLTLAIFIPSFKPTSKAYAQELSYSKNITSDVISNHNFNHSSSTKVYKPGYWSKINNDNDSRSDDYISGVVNFKRISQNESNGTKKLWEDYGLVKIPNIPNINEDINNNEKSNKDYALMINAPDFDGRLGYTPSKKINLESDSYYSIKIGAMSFKEDDGNPDFENSKTDPFFSIYLNGYSDKNKDENSKFEQIKATGFTYYTFYIATGAKKEELNFEFWLGGNDNSLKSHGAVFLSDIIVQKYSENIFNPQENDSNLLIDLKDKYEESLIKNPSFEQSLQNWNKLENSTNSNSFVGSVDLSSTTGYPKNSNFEVNYIPGTNFSASTKLNPNNFGLLVSKYGKGLTGIQSDPIKIERYGLYELSIWTKSNSEKASNIKIELLDLTKDTQVESAKKEVQVKESSNKYVNGWTRNSFIINGNPNSNKNIAIKISVNNSEDNTLSYAFIDDIKIRRINYETFSELSNSTKLDLNTIKSINLAPNYSFNLVENSNLDSTIKNPLKPQSWTEKSTNKNLSNSGVVNNDLTSNNIGILPTQENKPKNYNNFLILNNKSSENVITFTSKSITLNEESHCYKLSFYYATSIIGGEVSFKLYNDDGTLYEINNLVSNNKWSKHTIYFKTKSESISAIIDLISNKAQGQVYFDEIILSGISTESFNLKKSTETVIDLSKESFEPYNNGNIYENGKFQQPSNWNVNSLNNNFEVSNYGIVDHKSSELSYHPTPITGNGLLYIKNNADNYLFYKTNKDITLKENTIYKISVWVKTFNIDYNSNQGATIIFNYGKESKEFLNINTCDKAGNNEFKQVSFYLKPEKETKLNVVLGLGNENNLANGIVFFDDFNVSTLADNEAYNKDFNENKNNDFISSIVDTTKKDEPKEDENKDENKDEAQTPGGFNWLIVPSIITALAIFVAIIGTIIKKINFRHHKKLKTTYDRNKTLSKELDKAEKIKVREELLNDLSYDLSITNSDIEKFNNESKSHLDSIESRNAYEIKTLKSELENLNNSKQNKLNEKNSLLAKDKLNVDKKVEMDLNKEISNITKEINVVENRLNKITSKIEKLKTSINEHKEALEIQKETIKNEIAKVKQEIKEISSEGETFETSRTKKGLERNIKNNNSINDSKNNQDLENNSDDDSNNDLINNSDDNSTSEN